jgi:hypothetical protein
MHLVRAREPPVPKLKPSRSWLKVGATAQSLMLVLMFSSAFPADAATAAKPAVGKTAATSAKSARELLDAIIKAYGGAETR